MSIVVKSVALIGAVGLLTGTLYAADGILIVEKTTSGGTSHTSQVQIEPTRMRAESTSATGARQAIVFDGTKQVLDIIDLDKQTYTEMTKADVDRLAGQMSGAMAQMQATLANLPPDQRAKVEAMMKGRGMPGPVDATDKVTYRQTGTDTVGKWTCTKYEGYRGETKIAELCTVDPKALGFSMADFDVARQLADFFRRLAPQGASSTQFFSIGSLEQQGYSGVPVRRISTTGGHDTVIELTDVKRQSLPADAFAVPAGFEKKAFGAAGRGR
jgi:hypothetical protein